MDKPTDNRIDFPLENLKLGILKNSLEAVGVWVERTSATELCANTARWRPQDMASIQQRPTELDLDDWDHD